MLNNEVDKFVENENNISIKKFNMDEFLENVGYNKFHYKIILIVSLILFVESCEIIIINIMLSTISKEFNLNKIEKSFLSTSIFLGYFIGSLISGPITNKYGRLKPIQNLIIILFFFSFLTGLSPKYFIIIFTIRIISGILIGIIVPSSILLIAESIPTQFRSFVLNLAWLFYPIGIIYICIISIYFTNGQEFNWRIICLINSVNYFGIIIFSFLLEESPRFLLIIGNSQNLIKTLNKIAINSGIQLTKEEQENIKIIGIENKNNINKTRFSCSEDFNVILNNKNNCLTSMILLFLFFSSSFIQIGLIFILPKIFENFYIAENKKESLKNIIFAMFIILPCPILRGTLSEIKYFGRRITIFIGFFFTLIFCCMCIFMENYLHIYSGVIKFMVNFTSGMILVYSSEVYETKLRGTALGLLSGIARIGGFMTPFLCEIADNLMIRGSFYLFGSFCIISLFLTLLLPIETLGRPLDNDNNQLEIKNI